ncbi:MAG: right-handed parallel beta-helix repeat-containing protein [Candidatus Thermoplasmatota archaeon]|nr:right-handed parallel beta-helix repeat-containing protein [Candidatus Thermoplasmatota archaeon]
MDKYPSFRKCLAVEIILVLIATGIIQSTAQDGEKSSLSTSDGKWLYVGGDGPGNYTTIQSAINASNSGDTVIVFSGIYYENVVINVSIHLIGEEKNTTFVDGKYHEDVIRINKNNTWIEGFTIIKSGNETFSKNSGINIFSSSNTIINCNFYDNYFGIWNQLFTCNNIVMNNNFYDNYIGMRILDGSSGHSFINNIVNSNDDCGLAASGTENLISGNVFLNHKKNKGAGLILMGNYNVVKDNHFENNLFGIVCASAFSNQIAKNNFIDNENHSGMYVDGIYLYDYRNKWVNNYWGGSILSGVFPKVLLGHAFLWPLAIIYPYIEVDWHPAKEPYDIQGMS